MTEKKLKGLFGGEADDAPSAATLDVPQEQPARGKKGRKRRRRRMSAEEMAQAEDFVMRYTTGSPSEGFTTDEAVGYLRQMRDQVPPEVMQRAMVETVNHLPEDQRKAFAEMLQRRQAGTGMVTIERTGEARQAEGRAAAQPGGTGMDDMLGGLLGGLLGGGAAQSLPDTQPRSAPGGMDDMLGGLLGGLLGGGAAQPTPGSSATGGNPFDDLLGGMLGGVDTAQDRQAPRQDQPQQQGTGVGDILGSPLGKAVLGGIAAYAMKEMMEREPPKR